jgi:inosine/xanthosine triphosphate pyrophosphatase family protein
MKKTILLLVAICALSCTPDTPPQSCGAITNKGLTYNGNGYDYHFTVNGEKFNVSQNVYSQYNLHDFYCR